MIAQKSIVFWDWNGTLLDDAIVCVEAMNYMLRKRKRAEINLEYYKSIFGFPVVNYYKELGFDFTSESFEDLSVEFISTYNSQIHLAKLQAFTLDILKHFQSQGVRQVVISAMEQTMLNQQVKQYGVVNYFDDVRGISDIYAKDKTHLAQNYIKENQLSSNDIIFIGDTLHDKEVADKIASDIILVSNGHQSLSRLAINGNKVIADLKALVK